MKHVLIVGLGGCLGAIARYGCSGWVLHHTLNWRFPLGTFSVNFLGCLIAGILSGAIEKHHVLSQDMRLLLFTGFLGGFTTFSALGVETVFLLRRGEVRVAATYVALSVLCCIAGLWLGMAAIRSANQN